MNDDYTIRTVRRARDDLVTYTVCDLAGVIRHVTVPFRDSLEVAVDPIIRNVIRNTRPTGRIT